MLSDLITVRQDTLAPSRRSIVSRRSWRNPGPPGHAGLEVPKALLGDTDVGAGDCAAVLGDAVQEDSSSARLFQFAYEREEQAERAEADCQRSAKDEGRRRPERRDDEREN